jgi:hypothetical protein
VGAYVPYDDSVGSRAILGREGVAYSAIPGAGYRYGKSCMLPSLWSTERRDIELKQNHIYRNRREYKCSCFSSRLTCEDMSESRGNRIIRSDGRPKDPYCKWVLDRCVNE